MYSNGTEVKIVTQNVFGDGNHESTQLVLNALYQSNPNNKIVLDIGTGTGVQAIYAAKWGAKEVLAVDIDYTAILTARNNFKRNNVEINSRLNIYNEDLNVKADITIANLPAGNLREFLKIAKNTMTKDGILLCSWPKQFNIYNECDLSKYEIIHHIEGIEYDAYMLRSK